MSEQENNVRKDTSTEQKMKELFDLMDEKAASGELHETDEDLKAAKMAETPAEAAEPEQDAQKDEKDTGPMSGSEAAAYEYSMMMNQYEAMLMDWQRREAEEQAEKEAAKKAAEADQEPAQDDDKQ